MEEKHIYSSSPWKKLQDRLILFKQELQKTIGNLKPRLSQPKPPIINTEEETPKKLIPTTPEIVTYTQPATEKPRPKKSKPKISKKFSKDFEQKILVFVLSTTIVVIIGLGIFLSYKSPQPRKKTSDKSPQTQASPTPSEDETVNWKTYTNNKYKFSFQYPQDWQIISVNGSIDYPPETPMPSSSTAQNILFVSQSQTEQMQLLLNILDNPNQLEIKEYFIKEKWSDVYIKSMEETSVNGFKAVKLNPVNNKVSMQYFIELGKYIADFQFSVSGDENIYPATATIFDQILSTFNFIK